MARVPYALLSLFLVRRVIADNAWWEKSVGAHDAVSLLQLEAGLTRSIRLTETQETDIESRDGSHEEVMASMISTLLADDVFDGVIVHCYKESCAGFQPDSGSIFEKHQVQDKVMVLDGADIDKANEPILTRLAEIDTHRTVRYRIAAWFSHLVGIELASMKNLSRVIVLEADITSSKFAKSTLETKKKRHQFVNALGAVLDKISWQALKFTAKYAEKKFCKGQCHALCSCDEPLAWRNLSHPKGINLCRTRMRPKHLDHGRRCDIRSSAAYALHKRAFPLWLEVINNARKGESNHLHWAIQDHGFRIDRFIQQTMDVYHVLPVLAIQGNKPEHEKTSQCFRDACLQPSDE